MQKQKDLILRGLKKIEGKKIEDIKVATFFIT